MAAGDAFLYTRGFKHGAVPTSVSLIRAVNWSKIYGGPHVSLTDGGVRKVMQGPFLGVRGQVLTESDGSAKTLMGLIESDFVFQFAGKTANEKTTIKNCICTGSEQLSIPAPDGSGQVPVIGVNFEAGVASGDTEATVIVHAADS
jgi:hypothetical protein